MRTFKGPFTGAQRATLLREFARLCERPLDHPAIARPLGHGTRDEQPYLVHAALPGTPADEFLRARGRQELETLLLPLTQAAAAIDFAAAVGVHHGLLGLADFIVSRDSGGVSGFGLMQALAAAGVAGGQPTLQDDIRRFAFVTFHLLNGVAFDGFNVRAALSRLHGVDRDGLERAFESAFGRADRRPASALEFAAALQAALLDTAPSGRAAAAPPPAVPPPVATVDEGTEPDMGPPVRDAGRLTLAPDSGLFEDIPLYRAAAPFQDVDSFDLAEPVQHAGPFQLAESFPPAQPVQHAETLRLPSAGRNDDMMMRPLDTGGAPEPSSAAYPPLPAGESSAPPTSRRTYWLVAAAVVVVCAGALAFVSGAVVGLGDLTSPAAPPAAESPADGAAPTAGQTFSEAAIDDRPAVVDEPARPRDVPAEPQARVPVVAEAPARPIEPEPVTGRILVHSDPPSARVSVDGVDRGEAPAVVRGLPLGSHTIEVTSPGYVPWRGSLTLTESRPGQSLDVRLEAAGVARVAGSAARETGALWVDSRPAGAQVFVDGARIGTTPFLLSDIAAGSHQIRIEAAGYRPWTASVTIASGERARVAASLEP